MITTDGANDFRLSRIAGQFVTIFDMSKNAMDARQIYGLNDPVDAYLGNKLSLAKQVYVLP